eukprot:m.169944 g.169944  ORF g.169944 m.169944 type:complete len:55 (+) comp39021_c1_seq9:556-720(+)
MTLFSSQLFYLTLQFFWISLSMKCKKLSDLVSVVPDDKEQVLDPLINGWAYSEG